MFILDINDKDQTTCPVASSIPPVDDTDLQQAWYQVFVQEVESSQSGKAEREMNDIMEIKRREPIASIWVILTVKN